jgi:copper chaperone CopZ
MNAALMALLTLIPAGAWAEAGPFKYRVTGLFDHDREKDLREAVKKMAELKTTDVTIVSIDFDSAEVTFSYDPLKLFEKGTKEKDWMERFDNQLKQASSHTFGVKALCTTPKEKLTRIEIRVEGPDCKGCNLAAYEYVAKVDGVEQATASLKDGLITALIDPAKTNRAALEDVLKKRYVKLKAN